VIHGEDCESDYEAVIGVYTGRAERCRTWRAVRAARTASGRQRSPTPNDDIANATVTDAFPFETTENTILATQQRMIHSIVVDTQQTPCGSPTQVAVYTSSPGSLTLANCDSPATQFSASAGATYYIVVASAYADGGTLQFGLHRPSPSPAPAK
jgi:hypothetical protein